MPLTRKEKAVMIDEVSAQLNEAPIVYITDYQGLSVDQSNELRKRFREAGVEFRVVKNTLLRLAMDRLQGYDDLYDHLHGPTAVAFSEEPAAPARVMKDFLEDMGTQQPSLKVAYVDGAIFDADALDELAALKSKDELVGDIVGLLLAPLSNVVGALQSQGETLAGAIRSIAEKEEA